MGIPNSPLVLRGLFLEKQGHDCIFYGMLFWISRRISAFTGDNSKSSAFKNSGILEGDSCSTTIFSKNWTRVMEASNVRP